MIPPLTVNKEQIDHGLSVLEEAVLEYQNELHMQLSGSYQKV
jgi:4-aminobutyrate aminotransferase